MSTKKISALALIAGASISATDLVPLVDMDVITPTTYKAQAAQVRSSLLKATGAGWDPADYLQMGGGPVLGSGVLRVAQGTLLVDSPFINSSATWNAGTSIMHHILVNVTDVVSHANSLLVDLQVAGVSKWRVGKAGDVVQGGNLTVGGTLSVGSLSVANEIDLGASILANVSIIDGFITGSAVGDIAVRTNARKMLFSTNNGTSAALTIGATGVLLLGTQQATGSAAGELILANAKNLRAVNNAGTNTIPLIQLAASDAVLIAAGGATTSTGGPLVVGGNVTLGGTITTILGTGTGIVTAGVADSGGAGFKLLRVPN